MFSNNFIIGLGGQGGRSIAAFRREMVKNPHDVAEMKNRGVRIEYLYVDSSRDQLQDSNQWEQYGQDVSLPEGDWIGMDVKSPISALAVRPNISPWLGDLEAQMAKGGKQSGSGNVMSIKGAGQLRRYGRALFAEHAQNITSKIAQKLQLLLNAGAANPSVCFHVFCTLGGGTGSGSLIDLLTTINRIAPKYTHGDITVMVYCYVAGDAQGANNVGYFFENEYAALRDLNALACRRYHPYMAGMLNNEGQSFYANDGLYPPVSQVYLSSEFTTNTDIKVQVVHMARGCFNMIATQGRLDATIQKGFSGEDLIQGNEGENPGDVKQSYRFAGMATKSWFIPISQVKEMLKWRHEARVSHLWLKGSGKYHQTAKQAADAYVSSHVFSNAYQTRLSELIDAKKKALTDECDEMVKGDDRAPDALSRFATSGMKYYQQLCDQPLDHSERSSAEEDCRKMVGDIVEQVRAYITEHVQWRNGASAEVWGLERAREYVAEIINRIQTQIGIPEESISEEDMAAVKQNLKAREAEWEKLGILSRAFIKLDETMLKQHCQDIMFCVANPLANVRLELQKEFYNGLVTSLQTIVNSLDSIIQGVTGLMNNASTEATKLESSLSRNSSNIYEVYAMDIEMMRKVLTAIDAEDLRSYLASYNDTWKEFFAPIDRGSAPTVLELSMRLRARFYDDSEKTHNTACGRNANLRSLLVASILERLAAIAGPDPSSWHRTLLPEVKDFLRHMPVSVALNRSGSFITDPQVAMQGVVAIGFPEDARFDNLAHWLEEQFRANWPTNNAVRGGGMGVYRHKSPEVIRLMYVPHWFPVRFASVVDSLYQKYSKSAREKDGVVKRYFANLDDEGAMTPPKERVELIGTGQSNETLLWDIDLARKVKVKDSSGTSYVVLQVDEKSGNMVILNPSRIGEYGKRYTGAEKEYPSADFRKELTTSLSHGIGSLNDEERKELESIYKKKQDDARARGVSDASDDGVRIQQELNYMRKKLSIGL